MDTSAYIDSKSPAFGWSLQLSDSISSSPAEQAKSPAKLGLTNFVKHVSHKLLFHKRKTVHDLRNRVTSECRKSDLGELRFKNFPVCVCVCVGGGGGGGGGGGVGGMPWTPLEKFPPLALIQILAPSGSLGLGTPLNLQRASPYNLESMSLSRPFKQDLTVFEIERNPGPDNPSSDLHHEVMQ